MTAAPTTRLFRQVAVNAALGMPPVDVRCGIASPCAGAIAAALRGRARPQCSSARLMTVRPLSDDLLRTAATLAAGGDPVPAPLDGELVLSSARPRGVYAARQAPGRALLYEVAITLALVALVVTCVH